MNNLQKKKLFILPMLFIFVFCGCTNNVHYLTWTLQSSKFNSYGLSDLPIDFPRYVFEYPSNFTEYPSATAARPPYNVSISYKFGNANFEELGKMKKDQAEKWLKDLQEWYLTEFDIFVIKINADDYGFKPPIEASRLDNNPDAEIVKDQIEVDHIQAEITEIKYSHYSYNSSNQTRVLIETGLIYNGFNIYITMDTPNTKASIVRNSYFHLIKTFKFLN